MDVVHAVLAAAEGSATPEEVRAAIEQLSPDLATRLWADIAAVLTVYDEHVPAERRGPWRHRLAQLVGYTG